MTNLSLLEIETFIKDSIFNNYSFMGCLFSADFEKKVLICLKVIFNLPRSTKGTNLSLTVFF